MCRVCNLRHTRLINLFLINRVLCKQALPINKTIARNRGHFAPAFIGQRSMLYCNGIKTKWRRGLRRLIKGETSSIQNTE